MSVGHYEKFRKIAITVAADVLTFALAAFLAQLFYHGTPLFSRDVWFWLLANLFFSAIIFTVNGLYSMPLRAAGISEALRIVTAVAAMGLFNLVFLLFSRRIPAALAVLLLLFWFDGMMLNRFAFRIYRALCFRFGKKRDHIRVMVVGAGAAGALIIREMKSSDKLTLLPVCVIDDDPAKRRTRVEGVPVVGDRTRIGEMVKRYGVKRIFVAMPAVGSTTVREICAICTDTGCRVQILPGVYQMLEGTVMLNRVRDVDINDLLGREPVTVNEAEVSEALCGRTILVTGGGGSIGSELCRQIAAAEPRCLIIFDIYENGAYEIEQELRRTHPALELRVLIGSVRDAARVNEIFANYHPDIVFHAAAHKHVPLMEENPREAVKNNVFGTWNLAQAASTYGADRFVLISTDKAVNPTNVMGATKRICEMIVQYFADRAAHTEYVAVRFGNVLGSNGSVIPLFRRQIAAGGPVMVTHKDMVRYFMTIPEAVSLLLQACAFAKGGEIFVLDMGSPVKILGLAENLIRLSGYKPYEEINIVFTGLRPGEKLYEELATQEEGVQTTANRLIRISTSAAVDGEKLQQELTALAAAAESGADVRPIIEALVPTFTWKAADKE